MRLSVALVLLLASTGACSRQKTLSHDELRSDITKAISLAAETELFADFVREQRSTAQYAKAHPAFLNAEIEDSIKQLEQSKPEADDESTVRLLSTGLHALSDALDAMRSHPLDEQTLAVAKARATAVREKLQQAQAKL